MARPKNTVDTVQVTLAMTSVIRDVLENLSSSGYYGKTVAETALILLKEKIRDMRNQPNVPGLTAPN
jgi:hypothetical protein